MPPHRARKRFLGAAIALEVGDEEKHRVEVEVSGWTGRTKVFVDGRETLNRIKLYSAGQGTEDFTVGTKEQHDVRLQIGAGLLPVVAVFVDGRLSGQTGSLPAEGSTETAGGEYPMSLRVLRLGLALGGLIVLVGGMEGEMLWAGQGVTFGDLMLRLLIVLAAGIALFVLSRLAGVVYLKPAPVSRNDEANTGYRHQA